MILHKKAMVLLNHSLFTVSFVSLLKEINFFNEITGGKELKDMEESIADNSVSHLFIDFNMPGNNVFPYLEKTAVANRNLIIIIISSSENSNLAFKLRQAGAHGFISKRAGKKEIEECLHTIAEGNYYLSPDVLNDALKIRLNSRKEIFTEREREILQYIASGKTIKELSIILKLSRYTVIAHRRNMMKKLEVNNMSALVKKAIEMQMM